jgi:putative oxidoreductase
MWRTLWKRVEDYSLALLRISIGIVFAWFGFLKVTGDSPADQMVAVVLPDRLDPTVWIPVVGWVEMAIGAAFLLPALLPWMMPLFIAQMAGTFLVLFLSPGLSFQGRNPLLLTQEGEFVVKNLVLLFAGLAVFAGRRKKEANDASRSKSENAFEA